MGKEKVGMKDTCSVKVTRAKASIPKRPWWCPKCFYCEYLKRKKRRRK